jgi:hypothetical protein
MWRATHLTPVALALLRGRSGANEAGEPVAAGDGARPRRRPVTVFCTDTGTSKATTMLERRLPARMTTDIGSSDVSRIRRAT